MIIGHKKQIRARVCQFISEWQIRSEPVECHLHFLSVLYFSASLST